MLNHTLLVCKGGKRLLKGSCAGISIFKIHRDERYYPEPEKFKPERFLAQTSENRNPFAFIPFSAGRRNCIGQRFAMLEIKIVVTNILRNFVVECNQTFDDLKIYSDMVLKSENPILITFKEKEK